MISKHGIDLLQCLFFEWGVHLWLERMLRLALEIGKLFSETASPGGELEARNDAVIMIWKFDQFDA